jgi:hypothetical protein
MGHRTIALALGLALFAASASDAETEATVEQTREALRGKEVFYGQFQRVEGDRAAIKTEEDAPVRIMIENPKVLPRQVQQLYRPKLEVKLTDEGKAELQDVKLGTTSKWRESELANDERFREVNEAYQKVDRAFERVKGTQSTAVELRVLQQEFQSAEQALAEVYEELPSEMEEEQAVVREEYRALQLEQKALYGSNRDDMYPPEAYLRIYNNSKGSLAVALRGDPDPSCSGFLIGDDLVLTANHCIQDALPTELEVRFNYEEDLARQPLEQTNFKVNSVLASAAALGDLDAALLELKVKEDDQSAGDVFDPLCISLKRVLLEDPVYVVGHPRGLPRTVHDNAFVHFPFEVTQHQMTLLRLKVESEFEGAEDEEEGIAEFESSYQQADVGGVTVFRNFSQRRGGKPTIGIDSDTFHGDSGAPTLHRRTHRVVGVFVAGEQDVETAREVGWRAHEAVLPVSEVVKKLDAALPGWRDRDGVCVEDG